MATLALSEPRNRYAAILMIAGLLSAVYFLKTVYPSCAVECYSLHQQIINGSAGSPYRYRVLSAGMAELVARFIPVAPMAANAAAYTALHIIALPIMLVMLYQWLKRFVSDDRALVGSLIMAVLLPLGFQNYGLSLYTPLEIIFFLAGLLTAPRNRVVYGVLVALATINRETGFILVMAYFVLSNWNWRTTAVYGLIWLGVFVGLRAILGDAPPVGTPADWWANNTGYWLPTAILNNLFIAPIWIVALVNLRTAPRSLRWLMLICLVYVPLIAVFGQWHEIRLQFVLFPVLLPIALTER